MGSGQSCEYPFGTLTSFNPNYHIFCERERVEFRKERGIITLTTIEPPFKVLQIDVGTRKLVFGNEHIGFELDKHDMEFILK
jgi:hypothetical protein